MSENTSLNVTETTPLYEELGGNESSTEREEPASQCTAKRAGFVTFGAVLFVMVLAATNAPRETAEGSTRSVIVMRHCARSTPLTIDGGAEGYGYLDNYTARHVPNWPVQPYQCLDRGKKLVENLAKVLGPDFPNPVHVFSDAAQRDQDTSKALLAGLNLSTSKFKTAPALFDPFHSKVCAPFPKKAMEKLLKKRWKDDPPPPGHAAVLKALQDQVLGEGVAPSLEEIEDKVAGVYYGGGSYVASTFAEVFEMQTAGGMKVAWGELKANDLYEIMKLRVYYRSVQARTLEACRRSHSNMLSAVFKHLTDKQLGTVVFVGHDADLDAIATLLDIKWNPDPFPENSTMPGSGLRFDYNPVRDEVNVTMIYSTYDTGAPRTVPVVIGHSGNQTLNGRELKHIIDHVVEEDCIEEENIPEAK